MAGVSYPTRDLIEDAELARIPGRNLRNALRAVARRALDFIRARWPVETAYSLSRWGISGDGERVYNDADYAEWVHIQEQYGGPPGLAERLWDRLKAGAIAAEVRRVLRQYTREGEERGPVDLAARIRQRLAERQGPTLRQAAIDAGQAARLQPPPSVAGGAVFDPVASAAGGLSVSAPTALGSLAVSAPASVPFFARAGLVRLVVSLYPFAPTDVIQSINGGDVRAAAQRLIALGRADVARRLLQEAARG